MTPDPHAGQACSDWEGEAVYPAPAQQQGGSSGWGAGLNPRFLTSDLTKTAQVPCQLASL